MSSLMSAIASLAAAGALLTSSCIQSAVPQHDFSGTLFLINRDWRVSEAYSPADTQLADIPGQVRRMRVDAAFALEAMSEACYQETGKHLSAVSGFRSWETQRILYVNRVRQKGQSEADRYVAPPGGSEHQSGLAMDLSQQGSVSADANFGDTVCGKWVAENAWRFGFILRYQAGWEDVTGYSYEPWHVRYLGTEAAVSLKDAPAPYESWLLQYRTDRLMQLIAYPDQSYE